MVQLKTDGGFGNVVNGPDSSGVYQVQLADGQRISCKRQDVDAAWTLAPRSGNGVVLITTTATASEAEWTAVFGGAAHIKVVDMSDLPTEDITAVIGSEQLSPYLRASPLGAQLCKSLLKHSANGHKNVDVAAVLAALKDTSADKSLEAVFNLCLKRVRAVEDRAVMVLALLSHFSPGMPVPISLLRPPKRALEVLEQLGLVKVIVIPLAATASYSLPGFQVTKSPKGNRSVDVVLHEALHSLLRAEFSRWVLRLVATAQRMYAHPNTATLKRLAWL